MVEKLVDNHDQALSKLDDIQRAAVAPSMNERLRSDVARAADFVRQQSGAEQKWQSEQLQRAAARDAANHADDPELFDHHLATGENTLRQQAKIDNVGDKLLAKQIADYRSGAHAGAIAALAQRDPVHAAGWYARYGDNLNQRDKMRVEAGLGPALADARAVADVDAASADDPTTAPVNPHAADDARLLLKMQGITPMMDQTALPALMQRYGNDPAKAWAAFEAGPETIDRLIAERGDDWYAGLGDDTRRFVGGNMRMLGVGGTSQPSPDADTQARSSFYERSEEQRLGYAGTPLSIVPAAYVRDVSNAPSNFAAPFDDSGVDDNLEANGVSGSAGSGQGGPRQGTGSGKHLPPAGPPGGSPGRSPGPGTAPGSGPRSGRPHDGDSLGALSSQYETGGRGPGTVSSGVGDPGGPSYGSYQLASRGKDKSGKTIRGPVWDFIASPEFAPWAAQFGDAEPESAEFKKQWQAAATNDRAAFQAAQHRYIERTDYKPRVAAVLAATGVNLDSGSDALRNAVWSTSVHHGAAAVLLIRAVRETNKSLNSDDPNYDSALIDNIYKVRIAYVTHIRDGYLAAAKKAKTPAAKALNTRYAQQFTNMLKPGGRFSDTGEPTAAQLMWVLETDIEKNWGKKTQ